MHILSSKTLGVSPMLFDPRKTFIRSNLLSTTALAAIRLLISLYCFTTIIIGYTWQAFNISRLELKDVKIPAYLLLQDARAIGYSFSFFTWLCFWSQAFYFLVSGIHTSTFARRGQSLLHDSKWFGSHLQLLHSLWYTSIITYPFLVSTVFWGTMMAAWPKGRYEQWLNLSVHGLNSVFATIEIIIPATQQPPISHLVVLLVVLSMYLGLAYLTKATQHFYVYEWLNPEHGKLEIVLHVIGYAVGISVVFLLVSLVMWTRYKLAGHKHDNKMTKGEHSAIKAVSDSRLESLQELPEAKQTETQAAQV